MNHLITGNPIRTPVIRDRDRILFALTIRFFVTPHAGGHLMYSMPRELAPVLDPLLFSVPNQRWYVVSGRNAVFSLPQEWQQYTGSIMSLRLAGHETAIRKYMGELTSVPTKIKPITSAEFDLIMATIGSGSWITMVPITLDGR